MSLVGGYAMWSVQTLFCFDARHIAAVAELDAPSPVLCPWLTREAWEAWTLVAKLEVQVRRIKFHEFFHADQTRPRKHL